VGRATVEAPELPDDAQGEGLPSWVAVTYRKGRELLRLATSTQARGGRRPWWLCPRCGRRSGVLYRAWVAGRKGWRCRPCTGPGYAVWTEGARDRAVRRVRRLASQVPRSRAHQDRHAAALREAVGVVACLELARIHSRLCGGSFDRYLSWWVRNLEQARVLKETAQQAPAWARAHLDRHDTAKRYEAARRARIEAARRARARLKRGTRATCENH
jgi:hypothetical protein